MSRYWIGCAGFSYKQRVRPTYARATWLFLRLLGLTYVLAFWSLDTRRHSSSDTSRPM